jgi:hypothetical protein
MKPTAPETINRVEQAKLIALTLGPQCLLDESGYA